jgi:phosphate transport system protein
MLKELVKLWKNRGIMIKAVDLFGLMLEDCAFVFDQSWKAFIGELNVDKGKNIIYTRDKEVNGKEREIRRLLVEHLTLSPAGDLTGCLALMSMVKDAERIGDYSKNIFDLTVMVNGTPGTLRYMDKITTLHDTIDSSLKSLKTAFTESDEQLAKEIISHYDQVKKECTVILKELFKQDIPKQEALITVLLARYLKRINSHVSNVASGIILPLDQIDFVRGGLLE